MTREITDDEVLETADRLTKQLALTSDDRDAITLALQRMLWPPSPHGWMHEGEHIQLVVKAHGYSRWQGELRCPSGCGRRWSVPDGASEASVWQALTSAHGEYRTGEPGSVNPNPRRLDIDSLLGNRVEYVEVHDERLTSG